MGYGCRPVIGTSTGEKTGLWIYGLRLGSGSKLRNFWRGLSFSGSLTRVSIFILFFFFFLIPHSVYAQCALTWVDGDPRGLR